MKRDQRIAEQDAQLSEQSAQLEEPVVRSIKCSNKGGGLVSGQLSRFSVFTTISTS